MALIIALANQKGGVAKTTSTINLAHALCQRSKRVLAVDMDPQASLTIYFGQDPRALEMQRKTIYWALSRENAPLAAIIIPGNIDSYQRVFSLTKRNENLLLSWTQEPF